jgi:hypothetical protein
MAELEIKYGQVYINEDGEQRLVISVERNTSTSNQVVIWRTADRLLSKGIKSQGSATLASFIKWPTSARKATPDDYKAFSIVESMRNDLKLAKQRIKSRKNKLERRLEQSCD